jgi:hypothetical protein
MDRLHTYPSEKHAKEAEIDTIKSCFSNNQYKLPHIYKKLGEDNTCKNQQGNDNKKQENKK